MIFEGDCLEIMPTLEANSVDCLICDPPFAMTGGISNGRSSEVSDQFFAYWWRDVCAEIVRVLKPEAEGFIFCDWKTAPSIADGFKPRIQTYKNFRVPQILYHYREMPGQGKPFRNSVDMIAYLRGPKSTGHRMGTNTENWISKHWYYGKHKFHPAEKDVGICEQLIKWSSDEGDTVLDPFAGSGTTGVASMNSGRKFILIEKDTIYCDIIRSRIMGTQSLLPLSGEHE